MINLTGTETDKNLRNAFSGESEAAMKYSFYAQAAGGFRIRSFHLQK